MALSRFVGHQLLPTDGFAGCGLPGSREAGPQAGRSGVRIDRRRTIARCAGMKFAVRSIRQAEPDGTVRLPNVRCLVSGSCDVHRGPLS